MFGQLSGQKSDWIFLKECVLSCKTYKQMAWAETGHNVRLSGRLSAQPWVAVATVSMRSGMICLHARLLSSLVLFPHFFEGFEKMSYRPDSCPDSLRYCSILKTSITLAKAAELRMDLHFNVPY